MEREEGRKGGRREGSRRRRGYPNLKVSVSKILGRVLTKFSANKTAVGLTAIECSFWRQYGWFWYCWISPVISATFRLLNGKKTYNNNRQHKYPHYHSFYIHYRNGFTCRPTAQRQDLLQWAPKQYFEHCGALLSTTGHFFSYSLDSPSSPSLSKMEVGFLQCHKSLVHKILLLCGLKISRSQPWGLRNSFWPTPAFWPFQCEWPHLKNDTQADKKIHGRHKATLISHRNDSRRYFGIVMILCNK